MSEAVLNPEPVTVEGDGGLALNVWDYGGEGPNLVLCHCTGTHGRIWDPIVPELLKHFRVLAPDARGHGRTACPTEDKLYNWLYAGEDLHRMITQLNLGPKIYAAGHSGGAAQIITCQAYHPDTFSRAVLIDPIVGPKELFRCPSPLGDLSRKRANHFASREDARARFASKAPMNRWTPETLDAYVQHGLVQQGDGTFKLACSPEAEGATYDYGAATDVFDKLAGLNFERSAHVTGSDSNVRYIIDLQRPFFESSHFVEIPDTTHFIPQERPQEVLKIILDTLL